MRIEYLIGVYNKREYLKAGTLRFRVVRNPTIAISSRGDRQIGSMDCFLRVLRLTHANLTAGI